MRKVLILCLVVAVALALVLGGTSVVLAGQPGQSCEDQPTRPGNASSAPGSAFNPDGVAGTHYAGTQPQNSKNPKSVSQYDVACFQVSNH
jgi:hypothetical protein